MISNNTTYKLKASKSSRDIHETFDYNQSHDGYENSSADGDVADGASRYHGMSRENPYKVTGRLQFRSSRMPDRRGGYRGRGAPFGRREYSDNFHVLNRKYDNFSRNSESGYHGKFYEPEKKNEIKLNLPEDTRISKLLRRLSIESDQDNSLVISRKLLEVLLLPDNACYVRKAFHILGDSMFDILQVSPGPLAKQQASRALGRMGYIMGLENDFDRYQNWLFEKFNKTYEEIQILFMKSLKETLAFENSKPVLLKEHVKQLIRNLVGAIETTESADVFKSILDVLMTTVEMYPDTFYSQFHDTIDLLFGWHVDHTQSLLNIEYISKNLQRIKKHFQRNVEFSVNLAENFLEDIINYSKQAKETNDSTSLEHVTVLILALNTILKCLEGSFSPANNEYVKVEFVNDCLLQIIKTLSDALDCYIADNTTVAANECIAILLGVLDSKSQSLSSSIYTLIDIELALINDFADATIVSTLMLISKVIKELSANLPIEVIDKLIGPRSEIVRLRYSPFKNIREGVVSVYQSLLNLKNVSLLQEAYRYVLGDLETVYRRILPDVLPFVTSNPFDEVAVLSAEEAELTVLFLLRCLSQLANASSIIVMWALKPSILELVGVNLQPYSQVLSKNAPALQYSLLYLLYSHCKCYNHFISNSNLVTKKPEQSSIMGRFALSDGLNINDVPNTSPNSGNFAIILEIINNTLIVETSLEVSLLLLQWLNDILVNSEVYLENLYDKDKFVPVTKALVKCGYNFNGKIVLAVYENLDKLLGNKQLSWSNHFLSSVSDLCKLHMNSNSREIRESYSKLCSNIPWDVAIVELNRSNHLRASQKINSLKDYTNYMISVAQHLHLIGSISGEMYPLQFKTFMNYLLKNETPTDDWLEEIFTFCWSFESESQMNMELYYELAVNSRNVLDNWATLEAAGFCVNSKLRTPLGKPNETFTKIEGALNQLGNDLVCHKKINENASKTDGRRVRLLIQFVEHLEKSIYNASEGCAMAMPQPTKLVRSFFIANSNTCNEWLSRIRMVVIHIALHSGDSNIALRHGQSLLRDMVSQKKHTTPEFERVAMFVTLALLNLKETEAISGLYVWCKSTLGLRFSWIKCAAEQSSKRYEIAVNGYKAVLAKKNKQSAVESGEENEEGATNSKLDSDIQHFILDQTLICYKELNNFTSLTEFYKSEVLSVKSNENGRRYWFNTIDWDCFTNLFNIDSEKHAFNELSTWDYKGEPNSWSSYDILSTTENNLYNIALKLATDRETVSVTKIQTTLSTIQKSIQDQLNYAPSEFLQYFSLMQYIANGLLHVHSDTPSNSVFLVSENFENEIGKIDSCILRQILWWSEYFGNIQNQGFNAFCSNLRLDVMKRARKEKNFKLATDHFFKFLKDEQLAFDSTRSELWYLGSSFVQEVSEKSTWSVDVARAVTEVIKLSYAKEDQKRYTFNLCAAASTEISKHADKVVYGGGELRKISSKILLKLAAWLQSNEQISLTELNSPLGKLLMVLPEIGMMENTVSSIIPQYDMAIGKLLQFSVHQCVGLGKSWNAFGNWCYRWGRKIIDHSSEVINNLTDEDCMAIKTIVPPETTPEDFQKILLILSQTRSVIDEEDIDSNEINTSEMIQNQLQCVSALRNASEIQLESLIEIWRNTQKRIYTYYALSAEAYFKYLQLAVNSENITKSTECTTITVTLRLLRLIVKYALELQSILEDGLQTTPTQPWKVIIPQLFSRLNHPESYVRHRVSDLLCRVAEDAPHLITFPAVVGALEGGLKFDFSEISLPKDCLSQNNECNDELNEDDDNYDSDTEESPSNALQSCFKTMVDTLSKQDPETIAQVQTLVKELRRITLLWDELWLGTLAQHQTEITKRQQQLEYEIEKVNENPNLNKEEKMSLIAEKHRIIIKPVIFVLEQLLDVTSVEPETPHEKQFQERYLQEIRDVIQKLKNPEAPEKPQESLQPLKSLQKKFQQKFHKRASYSLKMQEISPVLAAIKNTVIAMPGLATSVKTRVTIAHVSNMVSILPTKTKPKKLVFYGSDGKTYTYLFKGLEDLHLDERIMQFLSIANTMMAQNSDPAGHNLYRAKHYSVIPLGPRSGLISWVDGTTPVFALYKRWQQREIAKPNNKNAISNASAAVLRPSELFYNKLNPLLQEHGVKNIENRKEWPLSVLKQVLGELMVETPSDLLAKELWCNSVTAAAWWQVVKRYSYSVAVMSIIGYIIGLGDRHLDNVLVDLTSGEVVHIDYNVCFEKGKTLRVPEKVPFRLTPNIRDALGVTGVEGIFRLACENVLKTMRKGRETLLTLLEAFVYDPLIDWTVGGEVLAGTTFGGLSTSSNTRQTRKDLEKEVTLSMYNVRCTELRTEWHENKDELLLEIPIILEALGKWLTVNSKISNIEDCLQDLHQQMALVKEAEAHGANHPLYSLPAHYNTYHKTQEAMKTARKDLDKIISSAEKHIATYADSIKLIESAEFAQWLSDLNGTITNENTHIFDLVKEFLHNAGKNEVIAQCEQSEVEVAQLVQHQNACTIKCLRLLKEYNAILSQCPKSFTENHRVYLFLKWLKYLLDCKNNESCELVYEEFRSFLDNSNCQLVVKFALGLENLYKEIVPQVNKLYEESGKIRAQESTSLEKVYGNARVGVSSFLACEKGATEAFEFVIASELVLLNQNFLTLETAAHRSGDWLIKLTSRDGDWFLDDLVLNSCRAVEIINNLPLPQSNEDVNFYQLLNGIRLANNVYKGLQELLFNFHTIILPESMKKIQGEEVTVVSMVADLKKVILSLGMPIPEMIVQLEKILTCLLMQMDVQPSCQSVLDLISNVRTKFQHLVQNQSEPLSTGKMLLMGFNGLFDKLNQEMNGLVATLGNLDIPSPWKKIDQVKEAKSIAAHIFNPEVRKVLEDIFLLKKLQAMSDFFKLCQEMCQSFKGTGPVIILNDEQLSKSVRQFIADFISRQLLGISTESIAYSICFLLQHLGLDVTNEIEQKDVGAESKVPLDELYQKTWNHLLKQSVFTTNILSQASSLEANLKSAWEKMQEPKRLEEKLAMLQSSVVRIQTQLTVHNFMYEEVLNPLNNALFRSKFIVEIRNEVAALKSVSEKLAESKEKQKVLIESAYQRLNWAKGANPNVVEISAAFVSAVESRNAQINLEQKIARDVLNVCSSVLQHEVLRTHSPESKAYDKVFLSSFEKWRVACQYSNIKSESLSMTEESIMNLLTADLINNPKWLLIISEIISDLIQTNHKDLTEEKANMLEINDTVTFKIEHLKGLYGVHCKIMADVKGLIKTMSKLEECASQTQEFITDYRKYVEHFSPVFNKFKKDLNKDEVLETIVLLKYVQDNTEAVYESLLSLEVRKRRATLTRQDWVCSPLKAQQNTTKGQQRNAYAVGVWRRVKMKLEGRDPDPGRKCTPQEQVDFVIREATNLDNLALLYEGWTPWV